MGYREGIERGYRGGPRLPEFFSFSNLVELVGPFRCYMGVCAEFFFAFCRSTNRAVPWGSGPRIFLQLSFACCIALELAPAPWLLFRFPTLSGHLSVPCGTGPRRCAFAPIFQLLGNMKRQGTIVLAWLSYMCSQRTKVHCALRNWTSEMCVCACFSYALSNMNRQGTMVSAALSYMWRSTS